MTKHTLGYTSLPKLTPKNVELIKKMIPLYMKGLPACTHAYLALGCSRETCPVPSIRDSIPTFKCIGIPDTQIGRNLKKVLDNYVPVDNRDTVKARNKAPTSAELRRLKSELKAHIDLQTRLGEVGRLRYINWLCNNLTPFELATISDADIPREELFKDYLADQYGPTVGETRVELSEGRTGQ